LSISHVQNVMWYYATALELSLTNGIVIDKRDCH